MDGQQTLGLRIRSLDDHVGVGERFGHGHAPTVTEDDLAADGQRRLLGHEGIRQGHGMGRGGHGQNVVLGLFADGDRGGRDM